jgi:hypothetical protein
MRQQRRIGGLAALMTTSPESVWPDDLVRREIPWLTITLMRGPQLFLSFYLERIGRPILSASGTAGI